MSFAAPALATTSDRIQAANLKEVVHSPMTARYLAAVLPEAPRPTLIAAAELCLGFGPRCAIDDENACVTLDVSGCGHLYGGEAQLAEQLLQRLKALEHEVRLAIADGPQVAAMIARGSSGTCIAPPGRGAQALGPLPVEVLGYDEKVCTWFAGLGVYTVGEVQKLPPDELERRLGPQARASLRLIHSEDPPPTDWWQPPVVLAEEVELDHGVEALEPLLFLLKGLVDPLCARLEARGQLLARAEVWVKYEKLPGLAVREQTWEAVFPSPLRDSKAVLSVLKLRLEGTPLKAPVRELRVRFVQTIERLPRALHLWTKEAASVRALPALIAELTAELGPERVGCLWVRDRHAASARSTLGAIGQESVRPRSPWVSLTYAANEPLRCAQKPEPWEGATGGRLLVRRQGVEWWTRGFSDAWDSLAVWVPSLCATAWVDLRGGEGFGPSAWLRGWLEG
jgi:protein ImuB